MATLEELLDTQQLAHKASIHEGSTELLLAALVCNRAVYATSAKATADGVRDP